MECPALKLAMPVDYNVHQLQRPQSLPFSIACCPPVTNARNSLCTVQHVFEKYGTSHDKTILK